MAALQGPIQQIAQGLSFALVMSLGIDLFMMAVISIAEAIFSRVLNRELEYK